MFINKNRLLSILRWFMRGSAPALLIFCFAGTAHGQQGRAAEFEASAAYSYVRANPGNSTGQYNLNGGSGSLAYNFSDRISILADFGGYHFSGLPSPIGSNMYTFLFGPRVSFRKAERVSPFLQALVGGGILNASSNGVSAGENGLAVAVGGGIDVRAGSSFAIRVVEADYLLTRFARASGASATQNDVRISAGIVFRFGSK